MSTDLDTRRYGLTVGTPAIRSTGPIAFGPDGILFVADNVNATIFAIDVRDDELVAEQADVEELDARLAAYLGCPRADVSVRDMAVHPSSHAVYLSVMRGAGTDAIPLLVRVGPDGLLAEVSLDGVPFAQTTVAGAPAEDDDREALRLATPEETADEERELHGIVLRLRRMSLRSQTVTDLAYVDGLLLVAGASNEEFTSTLRRIPFPFGGTQRANSLEIFHVVHGKYETHSPLRTFVPYGGNASVLAAYTCTPIVQISVDQLRSGEQARGRTVADLGAMNSPIDMVAYRRDGEEHLLVSNARYPLIKIACRDIDAQDALTEPSEPVGVPREELPHVGVTHLAAANGHVLMLQWTDGNLSLRAYDTATL